MKKILVSVMVLAAVFAAEANAKTTKTAAAKPTETSADAADANASDKRKTHFEKLDTNNDGAIDKTEFNAYYDGRFKALDKNKDGKITKDEMPTRKKPVPAAQ